MVSETRSDFLLTIVGDGPDRQLLEVWQSSLGLLDRTVFFYGTASEQEVMQLTADCSFAVLNSNFETFSVVMAESLRAASP